MGIRRNAPPPRAGPGAASPNAGHSEYLGKTFSGGGERSTDLLGRVLTCFLRSLDILLPLLRRRRDRRKGPPPCGLGVRWLLAQRRQFRQLRQEHHARNACYHLTLLVIQIEAANP